MVMSRRLEMIFATSALSSAVSSGTEVAFLAASSIACARRAFSV
jgi:hypothetical protein